MNTSYNSVHHSTVHPTLHPTVYLIGAGPGDPELLTLKAARLLSQAQVVLVDDLVNEQMLAHVPADARIVQVGKRGGCKSTPQDFIQRLMVQEAQAGRRVVRLKGGDPFVFGRGGEEVEFCREHGVHCEVVPGITSGFAAATAIGVPVTHRADTHGVALVTGHAADESSQVDWAALAQSGLTLVVYMGVNRAADIERRLLAAGMAADMPVALIQSACTPDQRSEITTLAALQTTIDTKAIKSPAIMVIGQVVRHANALQLGQMAGGAVDAGPVGTVYKQAQG